MFSHSHFTAFATLSTPLSLLLVILLSVSLSLVFAAAAVGVGATAEEAGYFTDEGSSIASGLPGISPELDQNRGADQFHFLPQEQEEEETFIQHSQKHYQRHHHPAPENGSPVKRTKKHKKRKDGFPPLRGDGRHVLQPLPLTLGGKQFLPIQMAKNNKEMSPITRKRTNKKGGGKGGKGGKKDREAMEKQIKELQAQLKKRKKAEEEEEEDYDDEEEDYEASDEEVDAPPSKKVKSGKYRPFAVPYDESEAVKIKGSMRNYVCPSVKFIANEEEAKKCMKIAVMMTNHWEEKGLDKLSEEQLDLQMDEYMRTYGTECVRKFINAQRNQLGQALRKVFMELHKQEQTFTANQLLSVITRNPDLLLLKPTKFKGNSAKNKEKAAKNKEANVENRKHRNRFFIYLESLIPAVTPQGIWNVEQRRLHMLHCCQHLVAGELQDVVPVEEEAMILVMWENNHDKWAWQAMLQKTKGKNVDDYKKEVGHKEFIKQQPEALYSDSLSGNSKYGGWSEEGVLRFAEVRDLIKMARKDPTCRKVEMQFQQQLESKYPEPKKKKGRKKKVVPQQTRTSVAFGGGAPKKKKGSGKASLHVCYDSEEENKKLAAILNFENKNEDKKKAGKAKGKEVDPKSKEPADDDDELSDTDNDNLEAQGGSGSAQEPVGHGEGEAGAAGGDGDGQ